MKGRSTFAHRASWLLLVVYLSLVAASALHRHQPIAICGDCLSHTAHPAHLDSVDRTPHDCLLCQLLSALYIAPALAAAIAVVASHAGRQVVPSASPCCRAVAHPRMRAPPCC